MVGTSGNIKGREPAGRRLIFIQDMALSVVSSLLAILLVRWLSDPIPGFTKLVMHYIVLSIVATLVGILLSRSSRVMVRYITIRSAMRLFWASLLKTIVIGAVLFLGWPHFPSIVFIVVVILSDFLLTLALLLLVRFFVSELTLENARVALDAAKGTVLVSGTGDESVELADRTDREGRYTVVGFFTGDKAKDGMVIGNRIVYYCATPADLERLQWKLGGVDGILFPKVVDGDAFGETVSDKTPDVPQADGMSSFGTFLKRSFDVTLSGFLLLIFSPLIGICALAVWLEDRGPAIFSQERIGKGGKPFNIYKFRSMRVDAEKVGCPALFAGEEDPRLTKVGKVLRQHHLDELPQLWNVFRGDMSFIGYRPEREYYINMIMERNPRYRYLYQIRPGVTSYATLYNGYTDTLEKMLTRLDLDLYYLRNHSVWFDAKVLGLTFLGIVSGKKF